MVPVPVQDAEEPRPLLRRPRSPWGCTRKTRYPRYRPDGWEDRSSGAAARAVTGSASPGSGARR